MTSKNENEPPCLCPAIMAQLLAFIILVIDYFLPEPVLFVAAATMVFLGVCLSIIAEIQIDAYRVQLSQGYSKVSTQDVDAVCVEAHPEDEKSVDIVIEAKVVGDPKP